MIPCEQLLKPISAESACGEDLAYDPELRNLQLLIQGKPETQFSAAEEPNWRDVFEKAVALFGHSKDLRIALILCLAALKLDGVEGFSAGLRLVRSLLENYWGEVYPRLDPEDNNDSTERVNLLGSLTAPLGTFGDPFSFLENLRKSPLAESGRAGRFGMADVLKSQAGGDTALSSQITAAFKDTNPALLQKRQSAAAEALESLSAIDKFLENTIGSDRAPDWTNLKRELEQIQKTLAPYLPQPMAPETPAASSEPGVAAPAQTGAAGDGQIRSRADVIRTLDRICDYYARAEPSSPLPFLLKRAQRLVDMNFLEVINELGPGVLSQFQASIGAQSQEEPGGSSEAGG